jgi:hypothetical protein
MHKAIQQRQAVGNRWSSSSSDIERHFIADGNRGRPFQIRIPACMETTAAGSSVFLLVTLVCGYLLNQARENAESLQLSLDFLGNAQVVVAQGGVSHAVSANRGHNLNRMRIKITKPNTSSNNCH